MFHVCLQKKYYQLWSYIVPTRYNLEEVLSGVSPALNEVFTVTEGQVHQVFINNSIRAVGTAKETKGIVVTGESVILIIGTVLKVLMCRDITSGL